MFILSRQKWSIAINFLKNENIIFTHKPYYILIYLNPRGAWQEQLRSRDLFMSLIRIVIYQTFNLSKTLLVFLQFWYIYRHFDYGLFIIMTFDQSGSMQGLASVQWQLEFTTISITFCIFVQSWQNLGHQWISKFKSNNSVNGQFIKYLNIAKKIFSTWSSFTMASHWKQNIFCICCIIIVSKL